MEAELRGVDYNGQSSIFTGQAMDFYIGQTVPLERGRSIQGEDWGQTQWFALVTKPQKEKAAKVWLERNGVEVWYPTETAWRKVARGKRKKVAYERTVAPRYIFAGFTGQPQWDMLFNLFPGKLHLSGVVGHAGRPLPIKDDELCEMSMIPDRLVEQRAAIEDALKIKTGDKVEVLEGSMRGWVVDVGSVRGPIARLLVPLLGNCHPDIPIEHLRKLGGLD